MVKQTKTMRKWVVGMVSPIPVHGSVAPGAPSYGSGVPHLKLDDGQRLGQCNTCGATRLVNELVALGGRCTECAEL